MYVVKQIAWSVSVLSAHKMHLEIAILFALIIAGVFAGDEAPTIKTPLGLVEGTHSVSYDGRQISVFRGIPYAEPPTGKRRFKDPEPNQKWTGVLKANNTYVCPQFIPDKDSPVFVGEEDCLYVNVYVPKEKPNKNDKMDVIVHIHGGAFMMGSQDMLCGPGFLMDRDIIYVTMSYRLGPFGFLSTEDSVVSGNMGLKDQTMALRWIKENIASFGGNPDSVTITGLSAGAASVHYHYLSPLSAGLFHRGVSYSGTALAPWALQARPLANAKKLATNLGCIDSNIDKHIVDMKPIIECMRQKSSKQILEGIVPFYTYKSLPFAPFAPSIEKKSKQSFLSDLPYKLLQKRGAVADVPWLTSVVTEEGIFPAGYLYDSMDEVNERWNEVILKILDLEKTVPKAQRDSVSLKLRDHYLKGQPLTQDNFKDFIQMNSDRHFLISAEKAAKMQAQINTANVYFYQFGYRGQHSILEYFGVTENFGVCHGDDSFYLFTSELLSGNLTDDDVKMKDAMINMLIDFSKSGKPTIQIINWPALSNTRFFFLLIENPQKASIDFKENSEKMYPHFWDDLPIQEYHKHVSTQSRDEL